MGTKANNSSVEMDDGLKIAWQARTQVNTFGGVSDPNMKQEAGERKTTTSDAKAKAKKKAKMSKASRRKNK